MIEGELDHADRAVHDARARIDDRLGLLAPQHGARDLGGVGEVGDAHLQDLDAREREPLVELVLEFHVDLIGVAS